MIGEAIDGWQALQAARLLGPTSIAVTVEAGPQPSVLRGASAPLSWLT